MEIKFKEVRPETRINHLDVIGNHEKIIAKENNYFGIIVLGLIVIGFAALIWQKKYYEKTIVGIVEKNKAKNDLPNQTGVESETKPNSIY